MPTGKIHIYHGDGKGKTTCAMGLALRAAGWGETVIVAQFLKSDRSGERRILEQVSNIILLPLPDQIKFTFVMSEEEKASESACCRSRLREVSRLIRNTSCRLVVLDEVLDTVNCGMVTEQELLDFLQNCPEGLDVVLTGRNPGPKLLSLADYVTEMKKVKHPYDQGLPARVAIEY